MKRLWSVLGGRPAGARLERMRRSPRYWNGAFVNSLPMERPNTLEILPKWFFGDKAQREPETPLPVQRRAAHEFAVPSDDFRITWLGHSTLLLELDGQRFLTDPVFGDYASPGPLFGVKRFFAPPLALDDLPPLDAVVLSHDHYDHLNEPTIRALADRVPRFLMPLGVGAHLEAWGVAPERIEEYDWWEETSVGPVRLVATPARHFSGRGLHDRNTTLWCGWAFHGSTRRHLFSGDSGFFPGFAEIGERLGPFDTTTVEIGAYNVAWRDAHMGPEQAVAAHRLVQGSLMVPIHWATFNLAFHGWTEPAERLLVAAEAAEVPVHILRPGASLTPQDGPQATRWWPSLPWQNAAEAPIISSGLPTNGPL